MMTKVVNSNWKNLRALHDAIKRRNIYTNVRYVELDSLSSDLQPTATEDVFAFSASKGDVGQWFYTSARSGRQVFAFDRSGADMTARTNSFVQAVAVFAIRN